MKTLKFMLAAATAIGLASATHAANGVDTYASTGFEKLAVGTSVTNGIIETGAVDSYFYYAGATPEDNESVIIAASDVADPLPSTRPTGADKVDAGRANVLQVSTGTDPLMRTYAALNGANPQNPTTLQSDVYVDTLVQFTVTPYTDTVTPSAADKLMIYLKESVTTNEFGEITGNPTTNLVVVGGYFTGNTSAREYVLANDDNGAVVTVEPNTWHRLTVKAVVDLSGDAESGFPAFQIWVDGALCKLANGATTYDPENSEALDLFGGFDLADDINAGRYVLSLLAGTGETAASLQGVGFAGEGKVDDIVFSDIDPFFTAVDFTFVGVSGVTATQTPGTDTWTFTVPEGTVISSFLVNGNPVAAAVGATSYQWTATSSEKGGSVIVAARKQLTAADHPWYDSPKGFVLAENLPHQGENGLANGQWVSAFHGQGEDEYLGLTYSTNPLQFDLYTVDGTNAPVSVYQIPTNNPTYYGLVGFRGVAISKALGVAVSLSYSVPGANGGMYAFPLIQEEGVTPTEVIRPSTHAFDSAAFSPDGQYLFSNAIKGEGDDSPAVLKWSVAYTNGEITLTKLGRIDASGRNRCIAYARINNRDIVFALAEGTYVDAIDMTSNTPAEWTKTTIVSNLEKLSYGSLCVSGINATGATPTLTVATSKNGSVNTDVLNVYTLSVPASGAVSATLIKTFNEEALTAACFGDISDASRYGNTVYVTDDNATIYFGRPDNKLYAGIYVPKYDITFNLGDGTSETNSVYEGDTPVAPTAATVAGKTFSAWDPAIVPATAAATYTATYDWITYTITYKNADDSAFNEWASEYTAPATFTAETPVDLPVAANISLSTVGSQFNGWTNDTGAVTSTAGLYANLVVFADIGAGSTTPGWVADSSTVSNEAASVAYPALAGTALAAADAQELTDWATANSIAYADVVAAPATYVEAFLLNCEVADVATEKAAFVADITFVNGVPVVTPPANKDYNGTLQMKGSNDLSTWTNVEGASSSYKFYKYELSL